jgi:hypothetical protein
MAKECGLAKWLMANKTSVVAVGTPVPTLVLPTTAVKKNTGVINTIRRPERDGSNDI